MQSKVGRQLGELNRPSKLAVEAVLNGLVAYLATKEGSFANTPIRAFLWEVAKDTPSEISKRLLNGKHTAMANPMTIEAVASDKDQWNVLDGLLRMDASNLAIFLSWLEKATPDERRQMAEAMSKLTEEEQAKMLALTPKQAQAALAKSQGMLSGKRQRPSEVQADLDDAHRRLDEELRERQEKRRRVL
jgi:hypothetical protein